MLAQSHKDTGNKEKIEIAPIHDSSDSTEFHRILQDAFSLGKTRL